MNSEMLGVLLKVGIGGSVAVTSMFPAFHPDFTTPYLGVPFNVVIACIAGAYSSFSFGDKVEPRKRMYNLFLACVIMGGAWTAITNAVITHFTDFELSNGVQAGIGAIISCLSRFFIPAMIERIGPWLDKIPFLSKKKGD